MGEEGEGRDESAGWLGRNLGVSKEGKKSQEYGQSSYLFMLLMKLFTLR